ncbi:hypothetical protein BKA82DRAFT_4011105 [Pisolithus tinctorius]|nr:hypothetical protein BKA82DRAFT_4011105 [Pisolithus tinctorius]
MFGLLTLKYEELLGASSGGDTVMVSAIIHGLEKCWSKSDQDVFIAAVILNPMYKMRPFAKIFLAHICYWSNIGSVSTVVLSLLPNFRMNTWVQSTVQISITNHQCPDPIWMYESVSFPDQQPSPLQKLAQQIFSICVNSASFLRSLQVILGPAFMVGEARMGEIARSEVLNDSVASTQFRRIVVTVTDMDERNAETAMGDSILANAFNVT